MSTKIVYRAPRGRDLEGLNAIADGKARREAIAAEFLSLGGWFRWAATTRERFKGKPAHATFFPGAEQRLHKLRDDAFSAGLSDVAASVIKMLDATCDALLQDLPDGEIRAELKEIARKLKDMGIELGARRDTQSQAVGVGATIEDPFPPMQFVDRVNNQTINFDSQTNWELWKALYKAGTRRLTLSHLQTLPCWREIVLTVENGRQTKSRLCSFLTKQGRGDLAACVQHKGGTFYLDPHPEKI